MPSLKQLKCSIDKGSDNVPLTEYGTRYYDGVVETFVRVPSSSETFSIHLTSKGYIAPGLAMWVFMDGALQCNRNRRGLVIPDGDKASTETEIDFRVRQKEQKLDERRFIGREWSFQHLNTDAPNKASDVEQDVLEAVGTIEVVVLRCHGDVRAAANTRRPMNRGGDTDALVDVGGFDGANNSRPAGPNLISSCGLDGADDGQWQWPASPEGPEGRPQAHGGAKTRGAKDDHLSGLEGAFTRHGLSGYQAPRMDGQSPTPAPMTTTGWGPPPGLTSYHYPPPWSYPQWYPQQTLAPGYGAATHQSPLSPVWRPPKSITRANSVVADANAGRWESHGNDGNDEVNTWDSHDNNQADAVQQEWGASDGQEQKDDWNQTASNDEQNKTAGEGWGDHGAHDDQKSQQGGGWGDSDGQNVSNQQDVSGGKDWTNSAGQNNDTTGGDVWNTTGEHEVNDWSGGTGQADDSIHTKSKKRKDAAARDNKGSSRGYKDNATHRRLTRVASDGALDSDKPQSKGYWSKWNRSTLQGEPGNPSPWIVPEEPLLTIPESLAQKGVVSHQIQAGKGKQYFHSTGTPKYIDNMEAPYAVFVFKYRSKEALEKLMPGIKIKPNKIPLQERWATMSDDERLAEMLRLQELAGSDTDDSNGTTTTSSKNSRRTICTKRSNRSNRSKAASQVGAAKANNDNAGGDDWGGGASGPDNNTGGNDWGAGGGSGQDNNTGGNDWGGGASGPDNNAGNTGTNDRSGGSADAGANAVGANDWGQTADAGGGSGWGNDAAAADQGGGGRW